MARPAAPRQLPHRDADAEALAAALEESLQPDFMAEILRAESQQRAATATFEGSEGRQDATAENEAEASEASDEDGDELSPEVERRLGIDARAQRAEEKAEGGEVEEEEEEDEDETNAAHPLLNLADSLLVDVLSFLDEDTVGACMCCCRRLLHAARSEAVFETLCRRVFPSQNPRAAQAAAADRFALRKFDSWFRMFHDRPRVRYNGFYALRVSYYKKPELNMWTEIAPGTILQVIYYRYFAFQRDGTVLYAMLFRPPHEVAPLLRGPRKDVFRGRFHVDKDELFVSVPTNHSVVEFRLRIARRFRGHNTKLVLKEHYSFSEPDRSGWVDDYDTHDEEFHYYRSWDLSG